MTTTQQKINGLKKTFGCRSFTKQELDNSIYALPLQVLYNHNLIQNATIEHKKELSVDDLIADLNRLVGEDNYGSQLIPTQSSIGQTIVRYLTDNDIVIPVESTNLEDETELTDARLFVIVQENIQAYIDNFAHTRDYDNAIYCISYKDFIVPRFKNDAKRMMVYRDLCWAIATDFNLKYKSGERERPTLEEIMNALPELSWEGPIIGLDGEEIDLDAL